MKIGLPNRKVVFQPSLFRGFVSFREGILPIQNCPIRFRFQARTRVAVLHVGGATLSSALWRTQVWQRRFEMKRCSYEDTRDTGTWYVNICHILRFSRMYVYCILLWFVICFSRSRLYCKILEQSYWESMRYVLCTPKCIQFSGTSR